MELNSDAVQQLTNIKNWYAENKLKHPGVFGIFNEISVYDGVRYYEKRKDLPNLNKILGQVGYKIEHESSGAHDTTYNITDINGKIIAGDIPVTEIATWVDQNLDDKQKEEISDSFTKAKSAYEAELAKIEKTTIVNEEPILRHVSVFKKFCISNRKALEKQNHKLIKSLY